MEHDDDDGNGTALAKRDEQGMATIESQTVAMATTAEAEVKARYAIARSCPRDIARSEEKLLADCARVRFAESARYRRPVGKKLDDKTGQWVDTFAEGFSIRFAEAALRAMGNVLVQIGIIYEDASKVRLRTSVVDLEANAHLSDEVDIPKTVERKSPKRGQKVLGERANSFGEVVYIVEASIDEIAVRVAATSSKRMRTLVLRLVPADILEACEDAVKRTILDAAKKNPADALSRMIGAFAKISIDEKALDGYLSQASKSERKVRDGISDDERLDLLAIHAGIKEGATTWATIMADARGDIEQSGEGQSEVERLKARVAEKLKGKGASSAQSAPPSAPQAAQSAPPTQEQSIPDPSAPTP